MSNKFLVLATMSLLSSSAFSSTLTCESYYQYAGERVNLVLEITQHGPPMTAKLSIPSSPNSVLSGPIPTKGESAMLIGETSQSRIFLSGISQIKQATGSFLYRKYDVNISKDEFEKAGPFIIHIMSAEISYAPEGSDTSTSMQFTCRKK